MVCCTSLEKLKTFSQIVEKNETLFASCQKKTLFAFYQKIILHFFASYQKFETLFASYQKNRNSFRFLLEKAKHFSNFLENVFFLYS